MTEYWGGVITLIAAKLGVELEEIRGLFGTYDDELVHTADGWRTQGRRTDHPAVQVAAALAPPA